MKRFLCGLLFFTVSITYSQHTVTGTVKDAETGFPIPGVTISLSKPERATISNLEGIFVISELPEGVHELIVSLDKYQTQRKTIKVPVEADLTIELAPTAIEMDAVIISTPFHQLQRDNVMKVERATAEEIQRSGSLNIVEGISQVPGVSSISTGSGIGKPVIRGLSANRVLVYAQGVRYENQQFGSEHGLGLNSSGVESVEIIKGPASLLYGSDALGGVIYLNPERYAGPNESEAHASTTYYSNTEGVEVEGAYKASGEKLKFLVRGNHAAHSDYRIPSELRVTNTRFREFDIKSGLGYSSGDYRGDLRYNFNNSKTGIPEEIGIQSDSKVPSEPYQWVRNHILSLDNTYHFTSSSLDLKLGYLFNDRQEFEDHHGESAEEHEEHAEEGPALEMHLTTLNYDLKYHLPKKDRLEAVVGLQGMHQINENFAEEILIPDAITTDIGVMATAHYHFDLLDLQGGLRFDHREIVSEATEQLMAVDRSFKSYNGALGAKMALSEHFVARVNVATGFRAPNLAELTSYGSHHGTNRFEIGNPLLEHERNFQLDLALEYGNQHLEVFANGFYNRINEYIFLNPTGAFIEADPVYRYQQEDAVLYGGEAGIHLHPHPLDWLHVESSVESVIGKRKDGRYLPLIPAFSILNTLRVELPNPGSLGETYGSLSLRSVLDQDREAVFETATPGYSLLNATLGTSFRTGDFLFEVALSGKNLLDRSYISHLSRLKPDGIPNIGRNITFGLGVTM